MKTYTVEVLDNGTKYWYLNGELHREDGPAIEWEHGVKEWYLNGVLHREDGPAVEYADGSKHWYLNGDKLSEQEFLFRTTNTITLNGVTYKLVKV